VDDVMIVRAAPRIAFVRLTVCTATALLSLSGGVAAAATSPHASAAKKAPPKVVKPGDPGSSQYQEDVPSAFGSVPATTVSSNLGHPSGPPLPHAVATQLGNAGAAGRAAAALAAAGSPQRESAAPRSHHGSHSSVGAGGGSGGGSGSSGGAALAQAGSGRGIVGALVDSLVGSDNGVGALLPVLLGASVLLAAAFAMRRRRRGG
jgi:uncharacterized membrane protein YgcG